MLGVNVHINGCPIDMLDILNIGPVSGDPLDFNGKHVYKVKYLGGEFEIVHAREAGWKPLVMKILKKMIQLEKKAKNE
jgi:hypothetical protein